MYNNGNSVTNNTNFSHDTLKMLAQTTLSYHSEGPDHGLSQLGLQSLTPLGHLQLGLHPTELQWVYLINFSLNFAISQADVPLTNAGPCFSYLSNLFNLK